ncbi:hypothetical protein IB238_01510 [Rhizobium sp. ARZ01]|uniref:hypothetical protein n=1 Tax=Rhizobium sp. ARZ01 TaxID=2769313 RepID=UPI00178125BE|nr:hypothetical protein [Rhizobium sp. ARZ01]MBD9371316.1 hypothetical protein [Rhizobium sp. ARZ01]
MLRFLNRGLAGTVTLIFALTVQPAVTVSQPEHNCANQSDLRSYLEEAYAEKLAAVGVVNEQTIMEIYVADTGTFTVALTNPAGISCLVLSGQGWQSIWKKPGQKA